MKYRFIGVAYVVAGNYCNEPIIMTAEFEPNNSVIIDAENVNEFVTKFEAYLKDLAGLSIAVQFVGRPEPNIFILVEFREDYRIEELGD